MTHADDGALLRYLDGNSDDGRSAETAKHLRRCPECRERLEQIRSTLDFVSDALRRTDVRAGGRKKKLVRWRPLAAAAIIVLTATALFTPVAGWVADYARTLWSGPGVSADEQVPLRGETPAPEPETGTVSFSFGRDVFLLEVASRQDKGLLSIEIDDGDFAAATMSGVPGAETFVVLPTGLRILNSGESTASYSVSIPETVSHIDVVVAQGPATRIEPTRTRRSWTLELSHF